MNKHENMMSRIEKHGQNLLAIFPNAHERDPVKLCKKLRRLEGKAQAIALRLCNGPEYPGGYDKVDNLTTAILAKVNAILGNSGPDSVPVFINRDPRGYALKIEDSWVSKNYETKPIHRDWGGYGIIAPDLSND